jgi:hypothetical protein
LGFYIGFFLEPLFISNPKRVSQVVGLISTGWEKMT